MKDMVRRNYHWVIATVVLLQLFVHGGAGNNIAAYHVIPVTQALGISRIAFSFTGSIGSAVGIVSTLISGWLLQRFGYRKMAALGMLLAGAAYALLANTQSYWMLIAGRVLVGLSSGVCSVAGVSRVISAWFHRRRGMVLGAVTAATGIGSSILGLAQAWIIENSSWRGSFSLVGALMLLAAVLIYLLVRCTPEEMGLSPYGEGQTDTKKQAMRNGEMWPGFPMEYLRRRPAFYLMALCALLSCICVYMTQFIVVPYFQDQGMSAIRAGRLYSIMMLLLSGTKLLAGSLSDVVGAKKVTVGCLGICSVSLVLLMLGGTGPAAVAAIVLYAFCMPLTTVMIPLLAIELFGYYAQGQYIGVFVAMASAASMIASPCADAVFGIFESYRPVFWGVAVAAFVTLGLELLLYRLAARDASALSRDKSSF